MKTRVFISYSRNDSAAMMAVKAGLSNDDRIEVRCDVQDIEHGSPVHREISNMINWSDMVVPIITTDWLSSHETRDELVRAHERRKYIVPLVQEQTINNENNRIPHFLIDENQIRFDARTIDYAIEKLIKTTVKYRDKKWQQKIFHDIRSIGDSTIEKRKAFLYQQSYASRIIRNAKDELRSILSDGPFEIEIGLEKNFLNRAVPIFDASKKIYAISIADISSFWIDRKNTELAYDYIRRQTGKEVYRLFVFSTPEQVVSFKNVLQANHRTYGGKSGGVFICSYDTYHSFISSIATHGKFFRDIHREDFGVLVFNPEQEEKEYVEAILDEYALKFRPFSPKNVAKSSRLQFMRAMENLSLIDEGGFGTEFDIYRWNDDTYDKADVLASVLSILFNEECSEVYHYVFIRGDEAVGRVLQELRLKFCKQKEDLHISKVNVFKTTEVMAIDGNYGGVLRVGFDELSEFNYVLYVEFEDKDALKHYYNHPIHSVERELLYVEINPDVEPLYHQARAVQKSKGTACSEVRDLYQQIEEKMKFYLFRLDIQRRIPFSYMAELHGIAIGEYRN
jgi:hypothetical protein